MSSKTQEGEKEVAAMLRTKIMEFINTTDGVTVEGMVRPGNPPYLTDGTHVSSHTLNSFDSKIMLHCTIQPQHTIIDSLLPRFLK